MIVLKSEAGIAMMRESGRRVGRILTELREMIKPGVETRELDRYAEENFGAGGYSGFQGL